ncbi:MAG: ParB N-terminal domain-containing protein [Bryobacteraceae bacterium]|nr:ParB N-terminal domain-containing protein [Bryobacteraceae bacterium]
MEPRECLLPTGHDLEAAVDRIAGEGGVLVASYRDPLGGTPLALAILPTDRIEPTPFQRDLSEAHHKRLADVIQRTGRFLDPVIVIPAPSGGFWTPNGRHRLAAMRRLGAKAISALVVPDAQVAWQILALNTEKAHNLRERSLEVIRIYRDLLAHQPGRKEGEFAFYLEEPALVTLGLCYERAPTFAGGAYHPILRRTDEFFEEPLRDALRRRERRAEALLDLDHEVSRIVAKLKERGLKSPYLRTFVVARINPLRWVRDRIPPSEQVLKTMRDRAARFDIETVRQEDLAGAVGPPEEQEE